MRIPALIHIGLQCKNYQPRDVNMELRTRITKKTSLKMVRNMLPAPATVIDVGVQKGAHELYGTFPAAHHLLYEPVQEHEEDIKRIAANLQHCNYEIVAVSNMDGKTNLSVTPNFMYAAVTHQNQVKNREVRTVRAARLDTLVSEASAKEPFFIKIDTDGHELSVLEGALNILKETEYIVIEATLFIQFHEIINFMKIQGFVVYDILEPLYRLLDDVLWQVDLVFVPENSLLRAHKSYASTEQFKTMTGAS